MAKHKGQLPDLFQELVALQETAKEVGADQEQLVKQLAIFATTVHGEYVLGVRWILEYLEVPDRPIIRALAPHLDATNSALRSFVRDWFQYHDRIGSSGWQPDQPLEPLNFSEYGAYIRNRVRNQEEVPTPFVNYIYSREPGHALLAFFYANEGRPPKQREILWFEHVVSNAIWMKENGFDAKFEAAKPEAAEQLQHMSKHDQWWVRLYVAKIMIRYPYLLVASIREQLGSDENQLVRQAAAYQITENRNRSSTGNANTGVRIKRSD